ncbi:hypothetical protein BcDW1_5390 [Botrytis cinerea BcDW1]|uniref:Uncharacterized protein n=2 Tax=Botryotinia fuckeliana TaxID=40559 RepID=G2YFX0_BOTF4|nr:hypothetical protein BcDW1_5390 [Botrytis cinerea BcDW1]CCD50668.1 hypothetical protein BofuT4_P024770.1 [Botrytis cinerea T4]
MPTVEEYFGPKQGDYPASVQSAASSASSHSRSKSSTHRSSKSAAASHIRLKSQDPKTQTSNTLMDDYNKKRRPGARSTYAQSSSGSVAPSKSRTGRLTRLLKGVSDSDEGCGSQGSAPSSVSSGSTRSRSARSSSTAPTSVHESGCGSVAYSSTDQHARIESWRQAVVPYEHQQALVPYKQPTKPASTIEFLQPDSRRTLYKPLADTKATTHSALVLHGSSQQSSSASQSVNHATGVAPKRQAKSRSEYAQSSSGRSSRSSRAMSTDGRPRERQKRRLTKGSSRSSDIPPSPPPPPPQLKFRGAPAPAPPPGPPPPPQSRGASAPGQPPPRSTYAPRHPQKPPPVPRLELPRGPGIPPSLEYRPELPRPLHCPPDPLHFSVRPFCPPPTEMPNFEEENLLAMKSLAEANGELAIEIARYNNNVDVMRYRTPMYFPGYPFLPGHRI